MKIAIVGLGYVGLPLAIQFARAKVPVLGIDIDPEKVNSINEGRSYIRHIAPETISEEVKGKRLCASTDFSRVQEVEAVVICVPTPLNKNREPDISYVLDTGRSIAPHLQTRHTRGARIHNLSRNHGRGAAAGSGGRVRDEGGR